MSLPTRAADPNVTDEHEALAQHLRDEPRPIALQSIGRYRLVAEIASGGQASVYLAVQQNGPFAKAVALKKLHKHLADEEHHREMFLDEARVASRVDHPNVCGVFDYGEEDGCAYLVMEYLVGEPLSAVIRQVRRVIPEEQLSLVPVLVRMAVDSARGLHAAHELRDARGESLSLVHRDISPQNLFVTFDGATRVVDFGIARTKIRTSRTETGVIKGKFAYLAPEQLTSEADRRSDIWALGVTFWEVLSGRRLFKRENDFLSATAIMGGDVPTLDSVIAIDPRLSAIVMRCLKQDPAERYQTAAELADALEAWLRDQPEPVGAAHVAALMHRLFPGLSERKRQQMATAIDTAMHAHVENSTVRRTEPVARPEETRVEAPVRMPTWAVVLAVAVLLLGGGLAWLLVRQQVLSDRAAEERVVVVAPREPEVVPAAAVPAVPVRAGAVPAADVSGAPVALEPSVLAAPPPSAAAETAPQDTSSGEPAGAMDAVLGATDTPIAEDVDERGSPRRRGARGATGRAPVGSEEGTATPVDDDTARRRPRDRVFDELHFDGADEPAAPRGPVIMETLDLGSQ